MGVLGAIVQRLVETTEESMQERKICKLIEEDNWDRPADLCARDGQLARAGDICHQNRAYGNAAEYYDKAGQGREFLAAALAAYRCRLREEQTAGWLHFDLNVDTIKKLRHYKVLEEFIEGVRPLAHYPHLYALAQTCQDACEEKLAAELWLQQAREDDPTPCKWKYLYEKIIDYHLKDGQSGKAREIALEWLATGDDRFEVPQLAKLREAKELAAFADDAVKVDRSRFFDRLGDLIEFGADGCDRDGDHDIGEYEDVIELLVKHYKEEPAHYPPESVAGWYDRIGRPDKASELRSYFDLDDCTAQA